eukprot:1147372-Pelagomonas_calceolata.AAC.2
MGWIFTYAKLITGSSLAWIAHAWAITSKQAPFASAKLPLDTETFSNACGLQACFVSIFFSRENAGRTTRKVIVDQMDPFRLRAQVGEHILIGPRPGRCTDREGEGDCGEQQRT